MKKIYILFFVLISFSGFAQLGFCEGSKGDPIFHEDFENISGALPSEITSYTYVSGIDPNDGQYAITSSVGQSNLSWHSYFPQTTISGGRTLIVNADFTSGKFYEKKISGLCENTTYEFSAFLMNVYNKSNPACGFTDIPINVRFEIWDESNTTLLEQGSTGNISSSNSPQWKQHALTFQTAAGQEAVILKMYNNGDGGCGNDLAIDDIIFRSCGDFTEITETNNAGNPFLVCEANAPVSLTLTATPDFAVYTQHAYQWQESEDGENWHEIDGETNETYTTPSLSSSRYYRVKVAEDQVNLGNNLCSSASEAFYINMIETPNAPVNTGDVVVCGNEEIPALVVEVAPDEIVNWYDAPVNGNLLAEGTNTYLASNEGTFYAGAVKTEGNCEPGPRTAVRLTFNAVPQVEDEFFYYCPGGQLQLDAGVENMEYEWSTGENTQQITISFSGNFSVSIITENGCTVEKNFDIIPAEEAGIEDILSEEQSVTIIPQNSGEFEYSLDGVNFQLSNTFYAVGGGIYTAYIRDLAGCKTVSQEFPHIVIPRFITPNNDGFNDYLQLGGVEYFPSSTITLFDRYGKLISTGNGETFKWDGTHNGAVLPSEDYWYEIYIENFEKIKGHISLKR